MRDGRAHLWATDVAARGIDLPKLDLVIHAELPQTTKRFCTARVVRAARDVKGHPC